MAMRKIWLDGSPMFQSGSEDCDTVLVLQEPADGSVKAPLENCDSGDFIECVLNFLRNSKERRFERYYIEKLRIANTCPLYRCENWDTKKKRADAFIKENSDEFRSIMERRHLLVFGAIAEIACENLPKRRGGFAMVKCPHPSPSRQNEIVADSYLSVRRKVYPGLYSINTNDIEHSEFDRTLLALRVSDYIYLRRVKSHVYGANFSFDKFCLRIDNELAKQEKGVSSGEKCNA